MKITDIRIFPVDEPKLKAFVSIIFDHSFIVSDIKVIEGNKGLLPLHAQQEAARRDIQGHRPPPERGDPEDDGGRSHRGLQRRNG